MKLYLSVPFLLCLPLSFAYNKSSINISIIQQIFTKHLDTYKNQNTFITCNQAKLFFTVLTHTGHKPSLTSQE